MGTWAALRFEDGVMERAISCCSFGERVNDDGVMRALEYWVSMGGGKAGIEVVSPAVNA